MKLEAHDSGDWVEVMESIAPSEVKYLAENSNNKDPALIRFFMKKHKDSYVSGGLEMSCIFDDKRER